MKTCSRHANLSVRLFARDITRGVPPPKCEDLDLSYFFFNKFLYPQTKVGDILDSGPSRRRRRRRRNFLVDAITQKQINIFFSNLVHMLRVPKGRSLF